MAKVLKHSRKCINTLLDDLFTRLVLQPCFLNILTLFFVNYVNTSTSTPSSMVHQEILIYAERINVVAVNMIFISQIMFSIPISNYKIFHHYG